MKTIKGWKWKQKHFFLTYLNMVWLRYWIRPLCAFRRAVPLSNVVSSHLTLPYKSGLSGQDLSKREKTRGELYTLFEIFFSKEGWRFFFSFLTKELPFKYLQTFVWRLMDEMIFLVMQNSFDKIVSWCWKHFLDRLRHFWPPVDLFVFQFWTSQMLMGCVHKLKS